MPLQSPLVSVVVPCYNEAAHLPTLLEALERQDFQDFEVILVDGGSTDGSVAVVIRWADEHPQRQLRLLSNPHRHIPHALNQGIAAAAGEVIVRLDGHAIPAPDYVSRCLAVLRDSGAEVVGGAWEVRAGGPGRVAEAIALAVSSLLGAGDAIYRLRSTRQPRDVDTVPFGCYRRALWQRLGGYNEALLTNEDYEFNWRVRQQGGRVRFDPGIRSQYTARSSLVALARQYWRYGWWKAQMLKRHPASLRPRQALPLIWAGGGMLSLGAGLAWPEFRLPVLLLAASYVAILAGAAAWGVRGRGTSLWLGLVAAFAAIHWSWGIGALAGLVFGRPKHHKGDM